MRWYSQAGTPEVIATGTYDATAKTYRLELAQALSPTPGQPTKEPMVIPLAVGLVGPDGAGPAAERRRRPRHRARRARARPAAGNVRLHRHRGRARAVAQPRLFRADQADGQSVIRRSASAGGARQRSVQPLAGGADAGHVRCWCAMSRACAQGRTRKPTRACWTRSQPSSPIASLEPAFIAEALAPPSEADIAREIGRDVDPDAIFRARIGLRTLIGLHLNAALAGYLSRHARVRPLQPGRGGGRPARACATRAST